MPSQSFSTAPWLARKTSELLSRPSMCTVQSSPGCDLGVPVAPSVLYSLSLLSASGASTMPSMSGESTSTSSIKVSSSSAGAGSSSSPSVTSSSAPSWADVSCFGSSGTKGGASCTPLSEYAPVLQVKAGAQ